MLLILEDNRRLAALLKDHLAAAGHPAEVAGTVDEFRCLAQGHRHALYIVDLTLPDGDGLELVREVRRNRSRTPILITTGRSQVQDRVTGLDSGADDYLVKPFNCDELLARVRALLRRPPIIEPRRLCVGDLTLDCDSGELEVNGARLDLRPSERRLLAMLIRRHGRVVPRAHIEATLNGHGLEATPNAIEKLVSRLRQAISDAEIGVIVRTIRGSGYLLEETR